MSFLFDIGLTEIELRIKELLNSLNKSPNSKEKGSIGQFNQVLGDYFQEINRLLHEYPQIDYKMHKVEKIAAKARISYAYALADLMTHFLKYLDQGIMTKELTQKFITQIEEFLKQKKLLLESKYVPIAEDELKNFHSASFRSSLENQLQALLAKNLRKI